MSSVEHTFREAMRAAGIDTKEPVIADGELHRVHVEGDKPGAKNGWYVLHANGVAAGSFGCWKRNLSETWCVKSGDKLTAAERTEFKRKIEQAKAQREAELEKLRAQARKRAAELWEAGTEPPEDHVYLQQKQVKAFGIRARNGVLLIPLRDSAGELHSIQFIRGDGGKLFLEHGAISGFHHLIGEPGRTLCVCEGYATAASVHSATGFAVAVAFNAGNLRAVAEQLKRKHPKAEFIVCADDDRWTDGNPGHAKAREAAQAIDARLAVPEFSDLSSQPTDFNDLARLDGTQSVREAIERARDEQSAPETRPPAFSDDALASEFTKRHGDELRYVAAWGKWFRWDRARWLEDSTLAAYDDARAVCRNMASNVGDERLRRQVTSAKTVAALERLAQADRIHAAVSEQWDADDFLLNTPAGMVDLRTGALRPHRRADYLTKLTGVAPDFERKGPLWVQFLADVTGADAKLANYLQRVAGYCLTGDTREHALFFNYGEGANGKNTFLDALRFAFGDYAKTVPAETLMEARGNRHPTELANLMGVRLAISNEIEEGEHWAEARLKSLTGDQMIAARFMRQDFFEFRKTHKHVIAGNHKPALRVVDEAIRRRLHLIPWCAKFDEKRRDRAMAQKLQAEACAILAWAIRGCQRWLADGLDPPEIVRSTTAEYLSAQDTFGQWLDECTVRNDPEASERSRRLYTSFRLWKQARGEGVLSEMRFSALLERSYLRKHTNQGSMFFSIRLTAAESARVSSELAK